MKKSKQLKPIPFFKNEDNERQFWAKADTTQYFDTNHPIQIDFPNLKLSTQSITVRLPKSLLYDLKTLANKQDVPYQSLLKVLLAEKVEEKLYKTKV